MANHRPITPYERLLKAATEYATKIITRKRVVWEAYFPKDKVLNRISFTIDDLYHTVKTARSLGFDTELVIGNDGGLRAVHVAQLPERPYEF